MFSADQFKSPEPPLVRLIVALFRSVSSVICPVTPETWAPPRLFARTSAGPVSATGAASAVTGVRASIARADSAATVLHAAERRRNTLSLKIPFFMCFSS